MRRREFITLLSGAAAAWPFAARAQQPSSLVGVLHSGSHTTFAPFMIAFRRGLQEGGFIEGQNVTIEYRWAENQYDRLPVMAAELVHRQPAVVLGEEAGGAWVAGLRYGEGILYTKNAGDLRVYWQGPSHSMGSKA